MLFYVLDKNNEKIYINQRAKTKEEFATNIGSKHFYVTNDSGKKLNFSVNDIIAEENTLSLYTSLFIGIVIGIPFFIFGIIIGLLIGFIIHKKEKEKEKLKVSYFNHSNIEI